MCACWRHPGNPNRINLGWKRMKKILSCFGLSAALGMLLFSTAWAEEPIETTTKDGVHLVWQYIGERIGYLAYQVQSSKSGIFELYWTCDGLRDDSKQEKHASNGATYIVNTVPNGPVEDTANVIVEKLHTNPDEKNDKIFRKVCEKQNLSLQKNDVFVIYDAVWVGEFLQFRNGVLINHKPEEHANPPISYMISVPKK